MKARAVRVLDGDRFAYAADPAHIASAGGAATGAPNVLGVRSAGLATNNPIVPGPVETPTVTPTVTPTSSAPQTPGFELVALVADVGAALVLVRRKA